MATNFSLGVIAALAFGVILSFTQTEAWNLKDCCPQYFRSYHVCLGLPNEQPVKISKPTGTYLDWFWVRDRWDHRDDASAPKCVSIFCKDGSDADGKYCGVGKCSLFGCDCVGGCREGNGTGYETLRRAWLEKHGLVEEVRHQFYSGWPSGK